MTRPDERRFVLFPRGHVRDQIILAHLRNSMRKLVNPDTNALFTEDEIARATQSGSRYYIQADAIDLYGQATQARNAYFVDQIVPTRAASPFLLNVHGPLWIPEGLLVASGASGTATTRATAGVIWTGSTVPGDPAAIVGTDPNGLTYQVQITVTTGSDGIALLQLQALDGGDVTNIKAGTPIKWTNPPIGAQPEGATTNDFTGGIDDETEADFAIRIEDRIHHRPASGNQAHFRAWAQQSSNAVEQAFIYAAALNAGSVVVCCTQKRANVAGPLARIPSFGTLSTLTGYLVPPNSPVVPGNVFVLVVPPNPVPSDISLRVALRLATAGGWNDINPWPRATEANPRCVVASVASPTSFKVVTDWAPVQSLPATGIAAPALMVWRKSISRFERLSVASVADGGVANTYTITLNSPVSTGGSLTVGDVISPYTDRALVLAQAIEQYFDQLGPGELVELATDTRAYRAFRFPKPSEGAPQRVGQGMVTVVLDVLGGAASDAELVQSTVSVPVVPAAVTDGPNLITLGQVGCYDIET